MSGFNNQLSDSQATEVEPIKPENFEFDAYKEYAEALNKKCASFWESKEGVLVYRRVRVADCFSYGCRDMKWSLENQLGALQKSMLYKADVPNFLEPWYGIGTISSAFGGEYYWVEGNAPALKTRFQSIDEVFSYNPMEVSKTDIGRHTLEMIDYFVEKTMGRIPISLTDSQSPLNMVGHLMPIDEFFMAMMMEPEKTSKLLDILADLSINFNREQIIKIGNALVYPGHGFASSSAWSGLGMSDDNAIMISPEQYIEMASPSVVKIGRPFGGTAFHSCGNWASWIDAVLQIENIKMADGAFSPETDPDAIKDLESFHKFAGTGIVLNARIVGNLKIIEQQVRRLWTPGMKLVVVTYCSTPEEQERAYDLVHEICR
jgi:uroporphyrinogen-III decarboxylase